MKSKLTEDSHDDSKIIEKNKLNNLINIKSTPDIKDLQTNFKNIDKFEIKHEFKSPTKIKKK